MPHIDPKRLLNSLSEMAKIGGTQKGGVCRLAATAEDKTARDLFASWAKTENCEISIDQIGNIFARRPGKNNNLAPVVLGSHLDSQPTGGKFDGTYGVLAALEVIRCLNDSGIETDRPVEAVSWTNEEGSRFPPAMMGSGVFSGSLNLEKALSTQDINGISIGEALDAINYAGEHLCGNRAIHTYLEAHIEQGPILERENTTIGVVLGIQGIRWFDIIIQGREAHAGPTPMPARNDALIAASDLILQIEDIALQHAPDGRTTVGTVGIHPNSRNVIPGQVKLGIDMRHPDAGVLSAMKKELQAVFEKIRKERRVQGSIDEIWYSPPTILDAETVDTVEAMATLRQYTCRRITSGAGHDAKYMADICPTGMIFIPCDEGLSHNEAENAKDEHLVAGAQVLLDVALTRAGTLNADS